MEINTFKYLSFNEMRDKYPDQFEKAMNDPDNYPELLKFLGYKKIGSWMMTGMITLGGNI